MVRVRLPAQHHADHAQASGGEALARRQHLFRVRQVCAQLPHRLLVARMAAEIGAVAGGRALVGEPVDVVDVDEAGQAPRDQAGLEAPGRQGQVGGRDESAEGLAQRRPRLVPAQLLAQRLGVVDDLVLAEVPQVVGLLLVRRQAGECLGVHARGLARASLVQQDHPVVLEETVHPAAPEGTEAGTRIARASLQEHRVGGILVALAHDLARKQLNRRVVIPAGAQVVQRDLQAVLVDRVSAMQVRLCVHGHNPIAFASRARRPACLPPFRRDPPLCFRNVTPCRQTATHLRPDGQTLRLDFLRRRHWRWDKYDGTRPEDD